MWLVGGAEAESAVTASSHWLNVAVKLAAASCVAAVLLSGCAVVSPAPTSLPNSVAPSTASSSERATTPEEWASAITPLRAKWIKQNIAWLASGCTAGDVAQYYVKHCIAEMKSMQALTASFKASVSPMDRPDARVGYIGTPPPEVERAWDQLGDAIAAANNIVPLKCPGKKCAESTLYIEMTWDDLGEAFTAWEPWL